jgi:hypothetical protein
MKLAKTRYANARAKKKQAILDYEAKKGIFRKQEVIARIASVSSLNPLVDKLSYNGFNLIFDHAGTERSFAWNEEPSPLANFIDFTPNCAFVVAMFAELVPSIPLLRVVDDANQILWESTGE